MSQITVLLITYNGERYFEKQLKSICDQPEFSRLIIQDDHSKESFLQFITAQTSNYDKEIKVVRNEENLGIIRNIKKIISQNKDSEWLALSDQDDIWESDKLEKIKAFINQLKIVSDLPQLIYHDAIVINSDDRPIYPSFWEVLGQHTYQHRFETFLYGNFITGGTAVFNQALAVFAKDIPEDLRTLHDAWLGLCAFVFGNVHRLDEKLNRYRHHENNVAFNDVPDLKNKSFGQKLKKWAFEKDFLKDEFKMIERFLDVYDKRIPKDKKIILQAFLKLNGQPTWYKKLNKHLTLRKFRKA